MADNYAIDSSSFIRIMDFPEEDMEEAWSVVERLASTGRLRTVEFVFKEVERNSQDSYERIGPLRSEMLVRTTPELHAEAGRLTHKYQPMSHPLRPSDSADPWVIALAKLNDFKVICEELAVKRFRMSQVCSEERIACGNLEAMLRDEGLRRR